jgi:hypothetical protein
MSAGKYNITMDQGSDFSLQLTVKESGSAKNLSGYSARGQIRTSASAASASASFVCTITNAAAGTLTIALAAATTTSLTAGQYVYDVEIYTGSTVQKLIQGTVKISAEVTK